MRQIAAYTSASLSISGVWPFEKEFVHGRKKIISVLVKDLMLLTYFLLASTNRYCNKFEYKEKIQMKVLLFASTLFTLNAFAAGGSESLRVTNVETSVYPRVEKYTYKCVASDTLKKLNAADWVTEETSYSGTGEDIILDEQNLINTEVDQQGRTVTKIKKEKMDNDMTKITGTTEITINDSKDVLKIESVQIVKKINGVDTVISNVVNGQVKPVLWTKFKAKLDDKTEVFTAIHNQPSFNNNSQALYSRMFQSCVYTSL